MGDFTGLIFWGQKKRPLISESAREKDLFLPGVVFFVPGGVGADVVGVPETAVVGTVFGGIHPGGDLLTGEHLDVAVKEHESPFAGQAVRLRCGAVVKSDHGIAVNENRRSEITGTFVNDMGRAPDAFPGAHVPGGDTGTGDLVGFQQTVVAHTA